MVLVLATQTNSHTPVMPQSRTGESIWPWNQAAYIQVGPLHQVVFPEKSGFLSITVLVQSVRFNGDSLRGPFSPHSMTSHPAPVHYQDVPPSPPPAGVPQQQASVSDPARCEHTVVWDVRCGGTGLHSLVAGINELGSCGVGFVILLIGSC